MKELLYVYPRQDAIDKSLVVDYDKKGKRRPAWIKLDEKKSKGLKFLTFEGKNEVTHYKLRIGKYYTPINLLHEEDKVFFNHIAKEFDDINSANYYLGTYFTQKVLKYSKKNAKIVDVLCATGITSEELVKEGFSNLTLIDFSKNMINKAKKKICLKNAKFVCEDFFDWKSKEKFDVIICMMGVHYYEGMELKFFLKKISDLLKKDGLFVCAQPSYPLELEKLFKKVESKFLAFTNKNYSCDLPYFIGRKK